MIEYFFKKNTPELLPALILEDLFPHRVRRVCIEVAGIIAGLLVAVWVVDPLNIWKGLFLFVVALLMILFALEAFFYSYFQYSYKNNEKLSFPFAEILLNASDTDIVRAFFLSQIGDEIMLRLGISEEKVIGYLKSRPRENIQNADGFFKELTNETFAVHLLEVDSLKKFFLTNGINPDEFVGCFEWVMSMYIREIDEERWWSLERLSRIPGLAKDWADKEAFLLEKISQNLTESESDASIASLSVYENAVIELEQILSKGEASNAVIVGGDQNEGIDAMKLLAAKITKGTVLPFLEHKKVFLIEPELLIEGNSDAKGTQNTLFTMLAEAAETKTSIVIFPGFISFAKSQAAAGADIVSTIKPFLNATLNLVFVEDLQTFDQSQSMYQNMSHLLETVRLNSGEASADIDILEKQAITIERHTGALITFPALLEALSSAKRYFSAGMIQEAKNILVGAVPVAFSERRKVVLKADILKIVENKTGVPTAAPSGEERSALLNLETNLHKKIIGQDEAIKAISSALRRARAGISSDKRPIGSFLFLGPTGVGKTETAKALADVMFGDAKKLNRIDMSEYQGRDALSKLIGAYGMEKQGALSTLLRDHPYGVVLLDEFEKAGSEVHNLFLQVLDEGFFTDGEGKKINARTSMFIATSNAGSSLIWDTVKEGKDLYAAKDSIIEEIIKVGIFAPELLNRFDGIILFHPLLENELRQVATLMLKELQNRLEEKAITLEVSPELLDFLIKKGNDPKFGARPMRRAIEEEVEEEVAKALIDGSLQSGMTAHFVTAGDFVKIEAHG